MGVLKKIKKGFVKAFAGDTLAASREREDVARRARAAALELQAQRHTALQRALRKMAVSGALPGLMTVGSQAAGSLSARLASQGAGPGRLSLSEVLSRQAPQNLAASLGAALGPETALQLQQARAGVLTGVPPEPPPDFAGQSRRLFRALEIAFLPRNQ